MNPGIGAPFIVDYFPGFIFGLRVCCAASWSDVSDVMLTSHIKTFTMSSAFVPVL